MAMMPPDIPPEMLAMLQGGMGAGGAPPQEMYDEEDSGPPQDTASFLDELIRHAQMYDQIENDPQDLALMAKVIAQLRQLMAAQQKEADAALGVGPAAKYLRRQQGGGF